MEYQSIEVKIDKTGKVFLEVNGVSGKKCVELTKELEESLGIVLERNFKPEYYDSDNTLDNYLDNNLKTNL